MGLYTLLALSAATEAPPPWEHDAPRERAKMMLQPFVAKPEHLTLDILAIGPIGAKSSTTSGQLNIVTRSHFL